MHSTFSSFRSNLYFYFISAAFLSLMGISFGQCALNLSTLKVSGDYVDGTNAFVTANVTVDWQDESSSSDVIVVELFDSAGNLVGSRQIAMTYDVPRPDTAAFTTRDMPNLQEVAFQIPADGATGYQYAARFINDPACVSTNITFDVPVGYVSPVCGPSDVGGIVFKDYNMDGNQAPAETIGVAGITVTIFGTDGSMQTLVTDRYGFYNATLAAAAFPVRVEFTDIPSSPFLMASTPDGTNSETTVQFIQAPACDVNLGVANPLEFCQESPDVFTTCFVTGDPLVPADGSEAIYAGDVDALVSMSYSISGNVDKDNMEMAALVSQVGAIWGLAWNPVQSRMYSASFVKRHSGLGSLGLGGIYVTDYTPDSDGLPGAFGVDGWDAMSVTTNFIDLTTLGVNVGTISNNMDRGLISDASAPSYDLEAFDKVGKVGLGDIDISEDSSTLYAVNLFERSLVEVPLPANGSAPTSATSYPIPTNLFPCTNGELRPWAVKVNDGKVYVGAVCTAENGGVIEDLAAVIYEFTPGAGTWTTVMDFPLTYPKGSSVAYNGTLRASSGWYPWASDASVQSVDAGNGDLVWPTPILADIEFDIDGSMVLAFNDRTSTQFGHKNYYPDPTQTDTTLLRPLASGDILRAFNAGNGIFILENNAQAGPTVGAGTGNDQGPGLGEFYNDDFANAHSEIMVGGVAILPGSGETIGAAMDPFISRSNGLRWFDNSTGLANQDYTVFREPNNNNLFGTSNKGNGLGDIELVCAPPVVLEIGNRFWVDLDGDGVQDPDEAPIPNVIVHLYDTNGVIVATTTTDPSGEYYFDYEDGVRPNTDYFVVVDPTNFNAGQPLESLFVTLPFAGSTLNDNNGVDLDGSIAGLPPALDGLVGATVSTGSLLENDHTFDFGFTPLLFDLALTKTDATPDPITPGADVTFTITVFNQGTTPEQDVTNAQVTEHPPAGWVLNDPNWPGGVYTIPALAAGSSTQITVTVTAPNSIQQGTYTNYAEVTSFENSEGNPVTDVDSDPDLGPFGDPDEIDDATTDPNDHDDLDPGVVTICLKPKCLGGTIVPQ